MTDTSTQDVQQEQVAQVEQQLSPELQYLQELFNKFNANREDETLTTAQKVLLSGIADYEKSLLDLNKQLETLSGEINDRQKKAQEVRDLALRTKGASDGLVSAVLKLKA